jgi:hypothetical protein
LKFLAVGVAAVALLGAAVMLLWNALLPALFGARVLGFWQALGLLLLSRILFGRIGRPGGMAGRGRAMAQRWAQMTPEEREQLRLRSRRGGCWGGAGPEQAADGGTAV